MSFSGNYFGSSLNQQVNRLISDSMNVARGYYAGGGTQGLQANLMGGGGSQTMLPQNNLGQAGLGQMGVAGSQNPFITGATLPTPPLQVPPLPGMPGAPPQLNNNGVPAQMFMMQMNLLWQMTSMMQQLMTLHNRYNQVVPSNNLSLDTMLQELLTRSTGATGPQNPALDMVRDALNVSQYETDRAAQLNPDDDDYAVSQPDLTNIQDALSNGAINETQLNGAFQRYFMRGDLEQIDEVAVLYAKLVDQGSLRSTGLLNPMFLGQLDDARQTALSHGLANAGLQEEDGTLNRQLAGWLLNSSSGSNPTERAFAQRLAEDMSTVWEDYQDRPEGQLIQRFLTDWNLLPATTNNSANNSSSNSSTGNNNSSGVQANLDSSNDSNNNTDDSDDNSNSQNNNTGSSSTGSSSTGQTNSTSGTSTNNNTNNNNASAADDDADNDTDNDNGCNSSTNSTNSANNNSGSTANNVSNNTDDDETEAVSDTAEVDETDETEETEDAEDVEESEENDDSAEDEDEESCRRNRNN
ncbi:MAG: hypothetical protein SFZ03_02975 [Candidatus Melainabacteria bacterium]|nr:hypothetical protein [Candidatus Melainabacteria bacterium]